MEVHKLAMLLLPSQIKLTKQIATQKSQRSSISNSKEHMNKKTQNHNIKHYWIFIDSLIDKYNFEECMNRKLQIKTLKPKITK
jgi:hypothetical protein